MRKFCLILFIVFSFSCLATNKIDSLSYYNRITMFNLRAKKILNYVRYNLNDANFVLQPYTIEYLKRVFNDKRKIQYYEVRAYETVLFDNYDDENLEYLLVLHENLKKSNSIEAKSIVASYIGEFLYKNNIFDQAELYIDKTLSNYRYPSQNYIYFNTLTTKIMILEQRKEYDDAIKILEHYLIIELTNIQKMHIYNQLAILYDKIEDHNAGFKYQNKALELAKLIDFKHINILYQNLGTSYYYFKDYFEAIRYYELALKHINENKTGNSTQIYVNLALAYHEIKEPEKAKDLFLIAKQKAYEEHDEENESLIYYKTAILFENDKESYISSLKMAEMLTEKSNNTQLLKDIYPRIQQVYTEEKNHKLAFRYARKYEILQDTFHKNNLKYEMDILRRKTSIINEIDSFNEEKLSQDRVIHNQLSVRKDIVSLLVVFFIFISLIIIINYYSKVNLEEVKIKGKQVRKLNDNLNNISLKLLNDKEQLQEILFVQKSTESQILEIHKLIAKNRLNVTLNHELNQHLQIIQNNLEMIEIFSDCEDCLTINKMISLLNQINQHIKLEK